MNAEHVISGAGAGAIGLATAAVLHGRGESVRVVDRSGHAAAPDGVQVVAGNATDPVFTSAVAAGARGSRRTKRGTGAPSRRTP
jgi:2-polyprenyl-6-methoxyphenol hydroxylase-like FAD-dependent oxidoreductase